MGLWPTNLKVSALISVTSDVFRKSGFVADDTPDTVGNSHALERLRLSPNVLKVGIGDAAATVADVEKAVVPVNQREALKEYGVRYREDRGIDADAESKRCDGHRREAGIVAQSPKTQANVARAKT